MVVLVHAGGSGFYSLDWFNMSEIQMHGQGEPLISE